MAAGRKKYCERILKMTASTEEFMKKSPRTYPSGEKNLKKVLNVLEQTFKASSPRIAEREEQAFHKLLEFVGSFPKGRETLEELSKLNYTFRFENMPDQAGACVYEDREILLNPRSSLQTLSHIFVHEARHALQHDAFSERRIQDYRAADFYKYMRGTEADAYAHEAAFLYDMKDRCPALFDHWRKVPVYGAYADEMDRSGDERRAMEGSFQAFYSYAPYREYYDGVYGDLVPALFKEAGRLKSKDYFRKTLSSEETAAVFRLNGKPYIAPAFFESPEAFALPETDRRRISAAAAEYARTVPGVTEDRSVEAMHSRRPDGSVLPRKTTATAPSLLSRKTQREV